MKHLFIFLAALVLALANPSQAFATSSDTDLFHRLIEVKRDEKGKLIELVLKKKTTEKIGQMSVADTLTQTLMKDLMQVNFSATLTASEVEALTIDGWSKDDIRNFNDAKAKLSSKQEIVSVLNNKGVGDILRKLENDLNKVFQYNVLAKPGAPGYFHERTVINKAIKKAMGLAKDAFGDVPALRVVFFLIDETIGMVEGKRAYSQFVLLHYLEKYPPSALGFTAEEVAFIKSSIYEGQIGWLDLKKLKKAKKNWPTYGTKLFAEQAEKNANRLAKYGPKHGEVGASYNYAFAPVKNGDVGYIVNSLNKKYRFSSDVSTAYDTSRPEHVKRFRIQMRLAQLAAGFLPIPGILLDQLQSLLSSYYTGQKITEGALYGALSSRGLDKEAKIVLEQSINPLLIMDLK